MSDAPRSIWVLLVWSETVHGGEGWDVEYAAITRDEIEDHETDVLAIDAGARTLVKEYKTT